MLLTVIINGSPLTICTNSSILDFWQGSEYALEISSLWVNENDVRGSGGGDRRGVAKNGDKRVQKREEGPSI